ncbi:MAG: hypothetical protein P8N02_16480, partial [Actinomycetota bacterium]|nr:hypothetical protein [Actinomycetota bacterium]
EVLAMGKLLWLIRQDEYDLVIMDGPATGHIVAHLASPSSVGELAAGGLLAEQTVWMLEMLADVDVSGVVAVTLPEEGPAHESEILLDALRAETQVAVVGCVLNRMPAPVGSRADRATLEALIGGATTVSPLTQGLLTQRKGVDVRQQYAAGWARRVAATAAPATTWSVAADPVDPVTSLVEMIDDEW